MEKTCLAVPEKLLIFLTFEIGSELQKWGYKRYLKELHLSFFSVLAANPPNLPANGKF